MRLTIPVLCLTALCIVPCKKSCKFPLFWCCKLAQRTRALSTHQLRLVWGLSLFMKTRLRAATPLPQHGARGDNYSLSDSHISMKNAYSWDSKHLIKRLTLHSSCLCLQKGECFRKQWQRQTTFQFSCCFVWVFSTLSWPAAGPRALFTQSKLSIKKQASCCLCRALYIISWGAIWVRLHWKTSCIYILCSMQYFGETPVSADKHV